MSYFWKHIWLQPQFFLPVIVALAACSLWVRTLRVKKPLENLTWRHILTALSLAWGLIMAVFYIVMEYTSPAVIGRGHAYMIHHRHWGIAGMWLSSAGILLSIFGFGAARALMTTLMLGLLWWWWFEWSLSFLTF